MSTTTDIATKVSQAGTLQAGNTLRGLLERVDVKGRFQEMLGARAPGFISSIISAANASQILAAADPMTVVSAAVMAATLDLPINPQLGFAHIVPFLDKKSGTTKAQFMLGWKGFVQLAMRTGQYKTMNASPVYEGELKREDRVTGEIELDYAAKKSDTVVGYAAYFRLVNGFEKYWFMSVEEIEKHGRRYSKSYDTGQWKKNFEAMALKTVLKLLLSKFGILSIDMQKALASDQGVIKEVGDRSDEAMPVVDFVDTTTGEVSDADAGTAQEVEK